MTNYSSETSVSSLCIASLISATETLLKPIFSGLGVDILSHAYEAGPTEREAYVKTVKNLSSVLGQARHEKLVFCWPGDVTLRNRKPANLILAVRDFAAPLNYYGCSRIEHCCEVVVHELCSGQSFTCHKSLFSHPKRATVSCVDSILNWPARSSFSLSSTVQNLEPRVTIKISQKLLTVVEVPCGN